MHSQRPTPAYCPPPTTIHYPNHHPSPHRTSTPLLHRLHRSHHYPGAYAITLGFFDADALDGKTRRQRAVWRLEF
jgi:hypothetical protein